MLLNLRIGGKQRGDDLSRAGSGCGTRARTLLVVLFMCSAGLLPRQFRGTRFNRMDRALV